MRPLIAPSPRPWLCAVALLLTLPAQAQVTVDGARWEALQPSDPTTRELPRALGIAERTVVLTPSTTSDGLPELDVRATWTVGDGTPAWKDLRVADASVLVRTLTIDGAPAPIYPARDGAHIVARLAPGSVIELVGTRPGDVRRSPQPLHLLAASSGLARITHDTLRPRWTGGAVVDGELWGGASALSIQLVEPTPPASSTTLAVAEVAMGVTVSDDGLAVRATVRHALRRGSLDAVVLTIPGAGADLAVTGPNVGNVARRGDRVAVTLLEPSTDLVALTVTWTAPVPSESEASLALPTIHSSSASRTERTLQLARTGDIEVLPALSGWTATASTEIPLWARGLIAGSATATFTGTGRSSGTLSLLRFVPVKGPEVMVDIADVLLATSSDGRVLLRARYEVLNDRAAVLPIALPPNSRLLSLTVSDEAANVSYDADGTLRVPLRRSIESLGGLLSFPVELAILVDAEPWTRRERRVLPLPRVHAPVAVLRTTAHLPPGYAPWRADALPDQVDDFSRGEGITYGIEVRSEEDKRTVAQADALFGEAVRAWESNEFEQAQGLLSEIDELGAGNANVERLQGNLSLLLDEDEEDVDGDGVSDAPSGQAVVQARRVREQAKAKAGKDEDAWEDAQREAEYNYRSGDYAKAEAAAEKALELGKKLKRYEQSESAEVSTRNAKVSEVLLESRKRRKSRKPSRSSSAGPAPAQVAQDFKRYEPEPEPAYASAVVPPPPLIATTRSVLVPELGAALRFQSLLLPSGAAPTVTLGARAPLSPQEPR